jgi:hypothetical protein
MSFKVQGSTSKTVKDVEWMKQLEPGSSAAPVLAATRTKIHNSTVQQVLFALAAAMATLNKIARDVQV